MVKQTYSMGSRHDSGRNEVMETSVRHRETSHQPLAAKPDLKADVPFVCLSNCYEASDCLLRFKANLEGTEYKSGS